MRKKRWWNWHPVATFVAMLMLVILLDNAGLEARVSLYLSYISVDTYDTSHAFDDDIVNTFILHNRLSMFLFNQWKVWFTLNSG